MDNKIKAIIASVITVIVILILVLQTGNSSNRPSDVADNFINIADDFFSSYENAENKEDVKKAYKETVSKIGAMIPGGIIGLYNYSLEKGGFDEMQKASNQAVIMAEFASTILAWENLDARIKKMDENEELKLKTDKIINNINDSDWAEMVKFTLDEIINVSKNISDSEEAMLALNMIGKEMSPNKDFSVTKADIDEMVTDYKKRYENLKGENLVEKLRQDLGIFGGMFD